MLETGAGEKSMLIQMNYNKKSDASLLMIQKLRPQNDEHILFMQTNLLLYMSKVFKEYYPQFETWYKSRVHKGFLQESRIIYIVRSKTNIYGVSILKKPEKNNSSNKICSFYISPESRGEGIGQILMERSLEEFCLSGKPTVITVPEERLLEDINSKGFPSFLQSNGFKLIKVINDKYRCGKKEFVFLRCTED